MTEMELEHRIRAYLAKIPGAVSGSGGHNQTYRAACALVNGFGLNGEDALRWLAIYNERCEPKWKLGELKHKIADALRATHRKSRGYLLGPASAASAGLQIPKTQSAAVKHYVLEPLDLRNVYHGNSSLTRVYCRKQDEDSRFAHARNSKTTVVNVADSATNTKNDPLINQLAQLLGATSVQVRPSTGTPNDLAEQKAGRPYRPTEAQLVRVPPGLSRAERYAFFQRDLEQALAYEPTPGVSKPVIR